MLFGTFYHSFQRLYIINLLRNLTLCQNFFETFLFFVHLQSITKSIKKGHPLANDLCVGVYIFLVIRLFLSPLFGIIAAAFITEYNGCIHECWAAP